MLIMLTNSIASQFFFLLLQKILFKEIKINLKLYVDKIKSTYADIFD